MHTELRPRTLLWVATNTADQIVLRHRNHPVLTHAIAAGITGAVPTDDGWIVEDPRSYGQIVGLVAETHGFVLPRAAQLLALPHPGAPISIEVIPEPCWGDTVDRQVSDIDVLEQATLDVAGGRCCTCGKPATQAQPVFVYDDTTHTRHFAQMEATCRGCWLARHPGYCNVHDLRGACHAALTEINDWDQVRAEAEIGAAMDRWRDRNDHVWTTSWDLLGGLVAA